MTLLDLQNEVVAQTDNEFDDIAVFLAVINIIIRDINVNHSAKFKTIDSTIADLSQDITTLTGMPENYDSLLIAGVSWKLQQKEEDSNWTNYQAQYVQDRNRYKHLVPSDFKLDTYNDIETRHCNKWDIW